ncbi:MAG: aminoacetone oxidase family FAD-binding enzyme, partial [Litoreibacter sp.]|nr:aminoacetone oxidase family FAD-binding enzyme [Litoreibacter sp.]
LSCTVTGVERFGEAFRVATDQGDLVAKSVVVATGGKSIPKMGATGFGYQIAEQFDIPEVETRPALVPLTFATQELEATKPLSGASVSARVSCRGTSFEEGLLYTHRGLSGPSILQISSYWREGDALEIDLHTAADLTEQLKKDRQSAGRLSLKNALARHLPEKLAIMLVARSGLSGNLADQSNKDIETLGDLIHHWHVKPVGSEGYRTAEVTAGGVDTNALDARTMQARSVPGLFFIGEVVDVTGWLGGYNFQWAWSSGWAAGQVA